MGKVWRVNKEGMEKAGGWSEPIGEGAEAWMMKLLWNHDDFDSRYHSTPSQTPNTKQHMKTDFLIKVANLQKANSEATVTLWELGKHMSGNWFI